MIPSPFGPGVGLAGGGWMHPLDPRPEDFSVESIAATLANICRFGGRCRPFYSVAQHSVHVMELVERSHPDLALAALLHDAAESVLGDAISPLKGWLWFEDRRSGYRERFADAESRVLAAVLFGLGVSVPPHAHGIIKVADRVALATEARDLMGDPQWDGLPEPDPRRLEPLNSESAERSFLAAFHRLTTAEAAL